MAEDLILIGATGTNVADLQLLIVGGKWFKLASINFD
jgi:hypothetical protein